MGKWKQVQKYAEHVPNPLNHLKNHLSFASFVLLLDVTYVSILGQDRAIFIAYDTGIGIIDYAIAFKEEKIIYQQILQRIKQIGYKPICVVSDGNSGLTKLLEEEGLPNQRCVVHLIRDLERLLGKKPKKKLRGNNQKIYIKMRDIWFTKRIEEISDKVNNFKRNEHHFEKKNHIIQWFWKTLPNAILHLSYEEKIPYTTNILENLNGQIKQRIKTMRGLKSENSLKNLLKIFFYFKKFK